MAGVTDFEKGVFVNCPFDDKYEPILQVILFCLVRFGLKPRTATERCDSGESRLDKIKGLILESKYSIHDLSRCQCSKAGEHYRMNMPFELGLDFGCRYFGDSPLDQKKILVLEEQKYRYQASISDLAGIDIEAHGGYRDKAVRKVRKWISSLGGFELLGSAKILSEYEDFIAWYYVKRLDAGFSNDEIFDYATGELIVEMTEWVNQGRPRN